MVVLALSRKGLRSSWTSLSSWTGVSTGPWSRSVAHRVILACPSPVAVRRLAEPYPVLSVMPAGPVAIVSVLVLPIGSPTRYYL